MAAAPSQPAEPEPDRSPIKGLSLPTIPPEHWQEPSHIQPGEPEEAPIGETTEPQAGDDWLTQLRSGGVEGPADIPAQSPEIEFPLEPSDEVPPTESAESEMEDWLAGLRGAAKEMPVAETEVVAEPLEPEPHPMDTREDWLDQLRGGIADEIAAEAPSYPPETTAAEEMTEPVEVEIPDWLQELEPIIPSPGVSPEAETVPPVAEEEAPALEAAEMPDWLAEIAAPPMEAEVEAPMPSVPPVAEEEAPALEAAEMPDWLAEIAAPPMEAEAEAPLVGEAELPTGGLEELPDWLKEPGIKVPTQAAPAVPPLVEFPVGVEATAPPDWLAELEKEAEISAPPAVPAFEGVISPSETQELMPAEIPAWMEALRPHPEAAEPMDLEPAEAGGVLEGIRGALPPLGIGIEVPTDQPPVEPTEEAVEALLSRAQLLQSLISQPEGTPVPVSGKREGWEWGGRIQHWLIMLTLLLAVVSTLILPQFMGFQFPPVAQPVDSPAVRQMYEVIEGFTEGTSVVVAFEYGPAEADELNLVTMPVLRHLFSQPISVTIVTTRPEGRRIAESILEEVGVADGEWVKADYHILGYRPGNAVGASQLLGQVSRDSGSPQAVVVLTSRVVLLQQWIEQTRAQFQGQVPVLAGLSAALEPVAAPYWATGSGPLRGFASGLGGAAAYEAASGTVGKATERFNTLAIFHLFAVGTIVLGAVVYALAGLGRKKS